MEDSAAVVPRSQRETFLKFIFSERSTTVEVRVIVVKGTGGLDSHSKDNVIVMVIMFHRHESVVRESAFLKRSP